MKRHLAILTILMVGAATILFLLYHTIISPNSKNNGFNRNFISKVALTPKSTIRCSGELSDICGTASDTIYFSDKKPNILFYTNKDFKRLQKIDLILPEMARVYPEFYTTMHYPYVYILGGNAKKIIAYNLISKQHTISLTNTASFSSGVALSRNYFIVNEVDTPSLNNSFTKIRIDVPETTRNDDMLPKLHDAGFQFDGELTLDPITGNISYVCFYANKIICFDSSLQLLMQTRTIDTNSTPRISVARKKTSLTNGSPPKFVNLHSSVYNGLLYVHSNLKADNESASDFKSCAVIDVYKLKDGIYKGSFYIRRPENEKLLRFRVINENQLIAIFSSRVVNYHIDHNII